MTKNKLLFIFFLMSCVAISQNSGVAINTTGGNPDPSAILDLSATDKGLLMPRLTTNQRDAIQNPAVGLMVFNTDSDCVEVYFGTNLWKFVQCGCNTSPNPPSAITGSIDVCLNQTNVSYSVPSQNGVSSYTWSSSDINDVINGQGTNSVQIDFVGAGTRTLYVIASNSCGSSDTTTLNINSDNPNSMFSPLLGTVNQNINFSAQTYSGATYSWTFDQGTPSSSNIQNPSSQWSSLGQFDVTLSITMPNGCTSQTTQQVTISNCPPPLTVNFTNCGKTGNTGPSQGQCNSAYIGTPLDGVVTVNGGIQEWVVPFSGRYLIETAGAQGGVLSGSFGRGAILSGEINLNQGDTLKILVGQEGKQGGGGSSSGGGGTYVTLYDNTALVVAGGAGGSYNNIQGGNGLTTNAGGGSTPGTNGNGGQITGNSPEGGPGGGLFTNGQSGASYGEPGFAFVNGGVGGIGYGNGHGGFGGGGSQTNSGSNVAGAGGGYSGGGSGGSGPIAPAGGGGSFINASAVNVSSSDGQYNGLGILNGNSIINLNSLNSGHGYVNISLVCP